ncbi:hypothetical protein PDIDSM_5303, partial [Penicillium digitatum]
MQALLQPKQELETQRRAGSLPEYTDDAEKYLFLHNVYANDQPARENMTSFAVKRDIFRSFFLDFDDGSRMDVTPAPMNPAPTIPTPTIPAPTIPAPANPAPVNPALMDLDNVTTTPGANLQLPNTEPSNQNEPIIITYQSTAE